MKWPKTIGIAGGMGPYAHIAFEQELLAAARRRLNKPLVDQDYPPWVLSSYPNTPDRTEAIIEGGKPPVNAIVKSITRIADAADFIVIPCNTAHAYLAEIRSRVDRPILDMIRATTIDATADGAKKAGLMATTGTVRARVFHTAAAESSLDIVTLLDFDNGEELQESLTMAPIYGPLHGSRAPGGVKALGAESSVREEIRSPLLKGIDLLREAGADLVILGCTELPIALRGHKASLPMIDPMASAARAAIAIAAGDSDVHNLLGGA